MRSIFKRERLCGKQLSVSLKEKVTKLTYLFSLIFCLEGRIIALQ